ncbi:MAG TPA: hypothetical protein PKN36_08965 [bacterium]|nr:hypothetical protein [bacterium]
MKRFFFAAMFYTFSLNIFLSFPLSACGPFFPDYVRTAEEISSISSPYTYKADFSGVSPGIIFPSWRVSYLYQAYRGMTKGDANMLVLPGSADASAHMDWLAARKSVTDKPAEVNRWAEGEYYAYFRNYLDDAFFTAVNTLNERKKVFTREEMDIWLEGQDEVFGSSTGRLFDEEFEKSVANPLLKYDRQYQRAAACFYGRRYGEAEERFRKIAENPEHPWKAYSALAVGRTLIRRANFEHDIEFKKYKDSKEGRKNALKVRDVWLKRADGQFENVLKNITFKSVHPSAERLREYIMFRLEPRRRMLEAERVLLSVKHPSELGWDLRDFSILYGRMRLEDRDFILEEGGDFSQWLLAFQDEKGKLADFAARRYLEKKSIPWLIASLKIMPADSPYREEILKSVPEIPESSPAYLSVKYYSFYYLLKSGYDRKKLAGELDSFLQEIDVKKDPAAWDCFIGLRMRASITIEDALKHSLRKVVAVSYDISQGFPGNAVLLDKDVELFFNRYLPLEKWMEIVLRDDLFTPAIMKQVRFTAFMRAILLDDFSAAEKAALKLSENDSRVREDFRPFLDSRSLEQKSFEAAFFILHYPRLNVLLDSASDEIIVEKLSLSSRDVYRRNWWGTDMAWEAAREENELSRVEYMLGFLPEGTAARAVEENKLMSAIAAPNYLAQAVIKYADANLKDTRVPEALHLAVQATRYAGFKDENTGGYSKMAFQLLHTKYPDSEWTKKTPYWYR